MSDIPLDLFTEILSRSPVQSVLRFRSTSKSLKSLIDSHNFTNLHLKNSFNFNLILGLNSKLYQLDFPNLTTAVRLKYPLRGTVYLLGSCNGLLCISNGRDMAFWNPNTRNHHSIPNIIRYDDGCGSAFYQFADDYKLLRISPCLVIYYPQPHTHTMATKVTLFSFKTNSWTSLPDIPYDFLSSETVRVRVENSFHWVMTGNLGKRILAFNITQEIFNEVPLPDLEEATNQINYVSVLGKCLCMTVSCNGTNKFDVWVMKEYGFRDSWCKLFTFVGEWCFNSPLKFMMPLCYSSDRSKVLLEVEFRGDFMSDPKKKLKKKLFWYYLKSYKVTYVTGIPNFNEAMIYVGSLLPPSLPIDNIAS